MASRAARFSCTEPQDEEPPQRRITEADIPGEIARFETALVATRGQILEMQKRIAESIGTKDASIFDAHLLVVEDRTLIDEVVRSLQTEMSNIEHVFALVSGRYARTLAEIDDPYLRERAVDIHDAGMKRDAAKSDGPRTCSRSKS